MAGLPPPKAPSSLVKMFRWAFLSAGVVYGYQRHETLKKMEDERRAREECERPAKEAAMKAEKERKSKEEMAYLGQQAGIGDAGSQTCDCPACILKTMK